MRAPSGWRAWAGLAAMLGAVGAAMAQQNTPHAGYVYPAGGRQGTTSEVTLGGQFLDGVDNAYVSGAGVEAAVVRHVKPMTQAQFNKLREQLQELTEKRKSAAWTAAEEKTVAEIREKIAGFIRRPSSPAIAETVTLRITIAPDAALGTRELRLATPAGLTNPLVFCVGQLPEFSMPAAKPGGELAIAAARPRAQPNTRPAGPMAIILPATINGQAAPGTADRYRFEARKGQHIVIAASARELMPYISDAVPGWFQATLTLFDAKGTEAAYAGSYRFHPDPVLFYEIPADGEYVLAVRDSIYRGREDFVYRIAIGELPFVTSIFPLGGKTGARTAVEVKGWNLPAAKVTEDSKRNPPGVYPVSLRQGAVVSNALPFAVGALPERFEKELNDQPRKAQSVKLPVVVNGRIDRPGDQDVFRFEGRAGEEVVAEVFARRLDSPLDSVLQLTDAAGRQLAANDDHEDKGSGLLTHHADSLLRAVLPKKGTYYVRLGDAQRQGGAEYGYRLRISRPQPDFELRVTPSGINVRGGMAAPITVYVLRRDGFAGEIALKLKDAPPGFTLDGAWIPAGQDKMRLTLTVPPSRIEAPRSLYLEGRATIGGREVRRLAVPAEDMMQAFAYRHLVPAQEWKVRVTGAGRARGPWKAGVDKPVRVPAGGTAPVRISIPLGRQTNMVRLQLNEPPDGISIQKVIPVPDGVDILLRADGAKVKPGLSGNLIVDAFLERAIPAAQAQKTPARRQPLGILPAIPFEIVAR